MALIGILRCSFDFGLEVPITLIIYHMTEETGCVGTEKVKTAHVTIDEVV